MKKTGSIKVNKKAEGNRKLTAFRNYKKTDNISPGLFKIRSLETSHYFTELIQVCSTKKLKKLEKKQHQSCFQTLCKSLR